MEHAIKLPDNMAPLMAKLHEFLFGAFGTDDVLLVRNETATHQTSAAASAKEAVVMPVTVFE